MSGLCGTMLYKVLGQALLGVLFMSTSVFAQNVVGGTVVSVDRDQGGFVLQTHESQAEYPALLTIQSRGDKNDAMSLPTCVQTGEYVRVWGRYEGEGEGKGVFQADVVRGAGLSHYDKSGVRSRLNRGRKTQHGRPFRRSRHRHKR